MLSDKKSKCRFRAIFLKRKTSWNPHQREVNVKCPLPHVKSFHLCHEIKLENLYILKYTWQKWMYFSSPKSSMFHSTAERGEHLCKFVCVCLKTHWPCMSEGHDWWSVLLLRSFQESGGLLPLPALCQLAWGVYMHVEKQDIVAASTHPVQGGRECC